MIKSLLHFYNRNDLTKDEIKGVPWKVVGTVASSQDGKFGTCLSMNGNGYLQNNTIDLSLDKEWTLDMWVYASSFGSIQPVFSISSGESPSRGILIEEGKLYVAVNNSWNIFSLNFPISQWVHFSLVNSLQELYAFVNGIRKVKLSNNKFTLGGTSEILLGSDRTVSSTFNGFIDDFRISD